MKVIEYVIFYYPIRQNLTLSYNCIRDCTRCKNGFCQSKLDEKIKINSRQDGGSDNEVSFKASTKSYYIRSKSHFQAQCHKKNQKGDKSNRNFRGVYRANPRGRGSYRSPGGTNTSEKSDSKQQANTVEEVIVL